MEKSRRHKPIEITAAAMFKRFAGKRKTIVFYEKGADVLYVNYTRSPIQKADFTFDTGDYVLRFKEGTLIGITVLDAEIHFRKNFRDLPINPSLQAVKQLIPA